MARKKKEEKEETQSPASDGSHSLVPKWALIALGTLVSIALTAGGIYRVYRYVDKNVATITEPPQVVLAHRPAWMSPFLEQQICSLARPTGTYSALNNKLLVDVQSRLKGNLRTNAWIKQIRQLKLEYGKRPGDTLVMDCEFRTPVALIHSDGYYYLVDGEAYSLPERYTGDQISKIIFGADGRMNIRVVEGVKNGPPSMPGDKWAGEDVLAALNMVKVLFDKDFTQEISTVDVSNFGGRQDGREAQMVLVTKYNTQIRWGRPIDYDGLAEVKAGQKLESMQKIYAQYKRVDAGYPWIDLRFDRITKPADVPAPTASTAQ